MIVVYEVNKFKENTQVVEYPGVSTVTHPHPPTMLK